MEGMEKQLTAVGWITVEAMKLFTQAMTGTLNEYTLEDDVSKIITKAKEMEKQQIIDAYNNGDNRSAEEFYNETFKSE
jgi:DNA polymerase elongation subunit (family B)